MGTLLLVGVPIVAVSQPFIPGFPGFTLLAILTILLGFAFWKSALNLQEHARAGAEVIVAALSPQVSSDDEEENLFKTMEHVAVMLPGLGEPVPVKITYDSPAVNRALSELNVRGKTGATILAITRRGESGNRVVVPSGKEVLREGDVLALAGTQEAVDAAVQILTISRRRRPAELEPDTHPD
jgi:CPA2 family monovalent cation:H+ antiporter-2